MEIAEILDAKSCPKDVLGADGVETLVELQ